MIKFKTLKYKNILSTGNTPTIIQLDKSPTTVITGSNGSGKCLVGGTKVIVNVFGISREVNIKDVEDILLVDPLLSVLTRYGYKGVLAAGITLMNAETISLKTAKGKVIEGSHDHLLWTYKGNKIGWVTLKNIEPDDFVETNEGIERVVDKKEHFIRQNLYDIQVEEVEEYYANGVVSHNSSIIDALTYSVYGRPFRRVNKGQLINTKNEKDLRTEIEFEVNRVPYKVIRGQKPEIFEIYKEGVLLPQPASVRNYQKQLEQDILKIDYSIFTQIVAIGKTQHVSFMKLDPAKRRVFVESLLGLDCFGRMNEVHAEKVRKFKSKLNEIKNGLNVIKEKIKIHQQYINDLVEQKKVFEETQAKNIENEISAISETIKIKEGERVGLSKRLHDLEPFDINNLRTSITNIHNKIVTLKGEVKTLKNMKPLEGICSCCNQQIPPEESKRHHEKIETELKEKVRSLLGLLKDYERFKERRDEYNTLNNENEGIQRQINRVTAEIEILTDNIEATRNRNGIDHNFSEKIETEENKLKEIRVLKDKLFLAYEKMLDESEYNNVLTSMLKDNGLKSVIISRFIKIMNSLINNALSRMRLFVKFELDENFDETILKNGFDLLSYQNFSEGEKLRIDMAILLAWREIAKLHTNLSTNLLMFDEIADTSLDLEGVEALNGLLQQLDDCNIFIITHTPEKIDSKMRAEIKFTKDKLGFSKILA